MARKALKRQQAAQELKALAARSLLAFVLLGLLWLAFMSGLILAGTVALMSLLEPRGPTNAGEIYDREVAEQAGR